MIVYLARAIQAFVMYCVNGTSRSSLLIESTDSMIYVRKRVRTQVSARGRSRTVLANERKRKRTRTQINAPLRLTRGRFLRANAFAFCALDLKLSGCTICIPASFNTHFSYKPKFYLKTNQSNVRVPCFNPVCFAHKFSRKWIKSGSPRSTYGRWIDVDPRRFNECGGRCRVELCVSYHV